MNKVIFEFYRHRTRLSIETLRNLKQIVDKELDRRIKADSRTKEYLGNL